MNQSKFFSSQYNEASLLDNAPSLGALSKRDPKCTFFNLRNSMRINFVLSLVSLRAVAKAAELTASANT